MNWIGKLITLVVAISAASIIAVMQLDAADAKRLPCPCPGEHHHRPTTKTLVGAYRGTTEEGGTVSFRITPNAKVVGFTLTDATLYCITDRHQGSTSPTTLPEYTKTLARISPRRSIPMKEISKKNPQGKNFELREPMSEDRARQSGTFRGQIEDLLKLTPAGAIVLPEKGFRGEVEFETANGPTPFPSSGNPTPAWAPGTEWCVTKPVDWKAKKPGASGYVP